jgi:excisionase family DNA binding protein
VGAQTPTGWSILMATSVGASNSARIHYNDDLDAYDIPEVCRRSGLGRSYVYEAIRRGELAARKFGRLTRVLRVDFHAWLNAAPKIAAAEGVVPPVPPPAQNKACKRESDRALKNSAKNRQPEAAP